MITLRQDWETVKYRVMYGVENVSVLPEIKDKIRETNLERYGFENVSQHPDIKLKISKNMKKI